MQERAQGLSLKGNKEVNLINRLRARSARTVTPLISMQL